MTSDSLPVTGTRDSGQRTLGRLRGNIYSPFAGRAKEVAWNLCLRLAPRLITPTDIDAMVECNGYFLFIELKTRGVRMPMGQAIAYRTLIRELRGKALLMVVEHAPLEVAVMPRDVESVRLWGYDPTRDRVYKSEKVPGGRFSGLYAAFFDYAEGDKAALRRVYRATSC